MSAGLLRRLALALGRATRLVLPPHQSCWARAMLNEIAQVEGDVEAVKFAAGCLWAAALHRLEHFGSGAKDPRAIGLVCAAAAVGLGLGYLAAAGAPPMLMVVNASALLLGLVAYAGILRSDWSGAGPPGGVVLLLGGILLTTALFGAAPEGAARWIRFGPLSVQVSLVVLPAMIIAFARRRDAAATAGMLLAAGALALQPDRGMAGALAAGLAALAILRFDARAAVTAVAGLAAFGVTLFRPDTLPSVPFVDRIFYSAFEVHALAGAAVVAGALLLVVPALVGMAARTARVETHVAFGTIWLAIIAAAALGNCPTPLVGYGGSAVLGYLLSLAFLPPAPSFAVRRQGEAVALDRQDGPGEMHRSLGSVHPSCA